MIILCFCCKKDPIWALDIHDAPFAVNDQPTHPDNINKDNDEFQMFVGFWIDDDLFAVYDQPAHPGNVNKDDDFQRFVGFRTCDVFVQLITSSQHHHNVQLINAKQPNSGHWHR